MEAIGTEGAVAYQHQCLAVMHTVITSFKSFPAGSRFYAIVSRIMRNVGIAFLQTKKKFPIDHRILEEASRISYEIRIRKFVSTNAHYSFVYPTNSHLLNCRVSCDYLPRRSYALFEARSLLQEIFGSSK